MQSNKRKKRPILLECYILNSALDSLQSLMNILIHVTHFRLSKSDCSKVRPINLLFNKLPKQSTCTGAGRFRHHWSNSDQEVNSWPKNMHNEAWERSISEFWPKILPGCQKFPRSLFWKFHQFVTPELILPNQMALLARMGCHNPNFETREGTCI